MDEADRKRFVLELEFVQCLSNPDYLQWLEKEGYYKDPSFIRYLKYLLYWCNPPYSSYLSYPHCLRLLKALQSPSFRAKLSNDEAIQTIRDQQSFQWVSIQTQIFFLERVS
ncbi:SOH1 family protein [Cryptosporidium muris RN66]|uniref:Mediator of RNA polymerase II transcription subunit 31 n=1 Tax=Cryptosporidium muris (strain RN66) TaxID=441375 RepID=B6AG08_CRYMR|nr:SOH1 family protein [Cryptosporidium muris RN66]EEA07149.1 SOH1 family protein [Cryptosporidium muris RN66]|eukprot:XP_002141498.1 SOH1 family protein [Cryptosporidium muris RN66]